MSFLSPSSPSLPTPAHRSFIHEPAWWCTVVGLVLLGAGLYSGFRIGFDLGTQTKAQSTLTTNTSSLLSATDPSHTLVGRIVTISFTEEEGTQAEIALLDTNGTQYTITATPTTSLFTTTTTFAPVLPNQQPTTETIPLGNLQKHDMLIVDYAEVAASEPLLARSIQLIR